MLHAVHARASPETHAKLAVVEEAESALPVDEWVAEIADAAEVRDYACPAFKRKKKRPQK